MRVPLSWLKDYLDMETFKGIEEKPKNKDEAKNAKGSINVKQLAHEMTMTGTKSEGIEVKGEDISNVTTGRIIKLWRHPEADKLLVSQVDTGDAAGIIQVITGADNVREGDMIAVALAGSVLPGGRKIGKGKLRGLESNGMMCSPDELELTQEDCPGAAENGILILDPSVPSGRDAAEVLDLRETVIDFEITPNRPDCLSMLGVAREAAATIGCRLKKPAIILKEEESPASEMASVKVLDSVLCPRYAARIIKDLKIGPSPQWMRRRLKSAGVRPINNIVDITNYVMIELGQPMHAFDLDMIHNSSIIVRRANKGEKITTLDGQERELDPSMLVIADPAAPVAVAGVMGGEKSGITGQTKTMLLESATFDGTSIRLTSRKLGMRSEASSRFEKGLDPENALMAINRAAQLIEELGAGKVCKGVIDCRSEGIDKVRTIQVRPKKINGLLGTCIAVGDMVRILESLEFKVTQTADGCLDVEIPAFRLDVKVEADIAEEVARFHGYNNIEATLLDGKAQTRGRLTPKQKAEALICDTMIACGLSEAYTYSFTGTRALDMLDTPVDSILRNTVNIINPLGEEFSIMRTTAVPEMLESMGRNFSRRVDGAGLFEMSRVYFPESTADGSRGTYIYRNEQLGGIPYEKQMLTIGFYGIFGACGAYGARGKYGRHNSGSEGSGVVGTRERGSADFYDMKGIVEALMDALRIKNYSFEQLKSDPVFHPGRSAKLLIGGSEAGVLGEVHPAVSERFGAPERTYIAYLDAEKLMQNVSSERQYKALPKYPSIERDIAMYIRDDVPAAAIEEVISRKAGRMLAEVKLFDVYTGEGVPAGKRSLAYSLSFKAPDRTLTDDEAGRFMAKVTEGLKEAFNAEIRIG